MDMKRDYYEDVQLFGSKTVLFWTAAFLIFVFTLPRYLPSYRIYLLTLTLVHIILAVGLNILVGYTGQRYRRRGNRCRPNHEGQAQIHQRPIQGSHRVHVPGLGNNERREEP